MLTNNIEEKDLKEVKNEIKQHIPDEVIQYYLNNSKETNIDFPKWDGLNKVSSLNLSKTEFYSGILKGIKGQYLIFEDQTVFNVRNHEGYRVKITF